MVYSMCACCAHVPVHPSAEVNFALLRQFSVSVSAIVTSVVCGDLISNKVQEGLTDNM
jgi:hypothetical protein